MPILGLPLWQFGLVLIVINTFTTAVGLLFFKRSSDVETHLPLWRRWRFGVGFFLTTVVLAITDAIAYSMTPLSLIAPFAGLTMVWSSLIAAAGCLGVRERLTRTDILSTALVLAGVSLVSIVGAHGDPDPTLSELRDHFSNPTFLTYAAFNAVAVSTWLIVSLCPCGRGCRPSPKSVSVTIICAYCAAACGSLTQVFVKVISTAVRVSGEGEGGSSLWHEPLLYIAGIALGVTAPIQLYLLNSTLASSSVTLAVPAYQSLIIILTIASGGIFFGEFTSYTPGTAASFVAAVLLVMVGLAVLSYQHQEAQPKPKVIDDVEVGETGCRADDEDGSAMSRMLPDESLRSSCAAARRAVERKSE